MPRSRSDLIADRFGVNTATRRDPETAVVGVVATRILGLNPNRLAAVISNLSAGPIYVKPALDVSATSGIVLAANGGVLTLIWDEDFDAVGLEWFAIAGAAGSAIFTQEIVAR